MDVSGATTSYRVADIVSPYGILRDSIPIPGAVIEQMAASIEQIRTQFPPEILVGPPNSLTFEVTEGRGSTEPQLVALTNVGVFGSLLGSTITTDAAYVTATPAQIGNLSSQESGDFEVAVDSSQLLAVNSPYIQNVVVEDPTAVNTPQVLSVAIVVTPKSVIASDPASLTFSAVKPLTGSFPALPNQTFEVRNDGPSGSTLNWQIQKVGCASWLAGFAPVSGTLLSSQSETITVTVSPPANLQAGTYTETLRVSGYSENSFVDVLVTLNIT